VEHDVQFVADIEH